MSRLTRRRFVEMVGLSVGAAELGVLNTVGQRGKLTAGEVVERIKQNQGVPWASNSFRDTFKIGNPGMEVTGISTSFGGNLSVLQKSIKAGLNMAIVHEPTFWTDGDVIGRVQDDPLYRYKLDWANRNHMIVWRDHDDIHSMKPDMIFVGWDRVLGWDQYREGPSQTSAFYNLPPTTLSALAKFLMDRLKLRSLRVIGDPNMPVSRVTMGRGMNLPEEADVKISSDIREWDSFEYARDANYIGEKKGLIDISHEAWEDSGMNAFAQFLKPLVPEVPVQYISTECIFWSV